MKNLKKIMSLVLVGLLCFGVMGCSSDNSSEPTEEPKVEESTPTEEPKVEESTPTEELKVEETKKGKVDNINVDNSEGTLTYVKHELVKDYEGKDSILVYYDYTNKQDETSYADRIFRPQAFQNGVECDFTVLSDDHEEYSNIYKEIQKGTTLTVAYIWLLSDTTNPVTIKVTDQSSENLFKNVWQEQELQLN
ncbi:DUF5067 domain-containing protein [Holdemania sp. 1001095H_141210_F2]|uniref:DUF5067 domain-containing protein n=1 Tax=Holdemania sp. 1001095H_141210_F2 TaxID=2787149 RepID=UPI00189CD444|nr:DUF5067 domain-containing protein [Holdemania sp. 1001095H_141210_F2]